MVRDWHGPCVVMEASCAGSRCRCREKREGEGVEDVKEGKRERQRGDGLKRVQRGVRVWIDAQSG